MNEGQWLLIGLSALGFYGVGQVWLVQLSSYPLWAYVGEREFGAYHRAWWRGIWGVILAPAALLIAGSALMLWQRAPGVPAWAAWCAFALQMALLLGTAIWWGPLMARLEGPNGALSPERYRLLLTSHWLRVAIVTAYALLVLWMLGQSAGRGAL
jgi:hypothetical protein